MSKNLGEKRSMEDSDNLEASITKKLHVDKSDNNQDFLQAVKAGDAEQVARFIKQGVNVNLQYEQKTALHWAVEKGHREIVLLLLQSGADIEAQDENANTPLHYAALCDKADIASILLEHNVNDNSVYVNGKNTIDVLPPLSLAARYGHIDVAKTLLKYGADIDLDTGDCGTALHVATWFDQWEMVKFLVQLGADTKMEDNGGMNPLHVAASQGSNKSVAILLCKTNPNTPDVLGKTPLHHAAANNRADTLKILFMCVGLDIDARDTEGQTALHYATGHRNLDVIKVLFNMGANFEVADNNGQTPLQDWQEYNNNAEIADYMMAWTAEVHTTTPNNCSIDKIFECSTVYLETLLQSKLPDEIKNLARDLLYTKLYEFYVNDMTKNSFPMLMNELGSSVITRYVTDLFEKGQKAVDNNSLANVESGNEGGGTRPALMPQAYVKSLSTLSLEKILPGMKAQVLEGRAAAMQHNDNASHVPEPVNTEVNSNEVGIMGDDAAQIS